MNETQVLLSRIVSLRQRLEQAHESARQTGSAAAGVLGGEFSVGPARVATLNRLVLEGAEQTRQLDTTTQSLTGTEPSEMLPARLTSRARRSLERCRDLLQSLRALADQAAVQETGSLPASLHRETTALTEAALRLVQSLPNSAAAQLAQCEGIEAVLDTVATRLSVLGGILHGKGEQSARINLLTDFLTRLEAHLPVDLNPISALAEALLCEAAEGVPLRFFDPPSPGPEGPDPVWVARSVACHGLTVAQIVARLVRADTDLRPRSIDALLAALLHDAGMLRVSPTLLATVGPLDDGGRRAIEAHCRAGEEMLAAGLPGSPWLVDAAVHHHERSDGTGYPDGRTAPQTAPLTRLLAVCDVYAALCCRRPYRAARETRTALTDTLLLAEQGLLDHQAAERLLQLSFYPVGTAVEMADGSTAVVVAAPIGRQTPNAPARPVVALVTDTHNRYLPAPRYLDLVHAEHHSIVRTLSAAERRRLLGPRYPEWAW
jgi:HD domain